ncbi:hypothetical protein BSL78_09456 [Apostichopus japonicus]|uniref:Uncharacterized protein n=1 Tax=Stichopus japonicus TaxID=307972 RepID=A0A2G8L053_STIJA|nr:hypothetical protein BSL78_09456 [Apostichopus japonicus]
MAQAPTQPGFPLNHQPIFIGPQQVPQNVGRLRGSGPRQATGSLIITCGIVQIILGIVLLVLPKRNGMDCVGWGIWNGVFAIITGSFGIKSGRAKSMQGRGRRASYIIICLAYGLEWLSCIIGASYTCVALCGANTQELQHVIVYQPYAMPPGHGNAANLYPGVVYMANQPASGSYGSPPTYEFATSQPEHKTYA